MLPAPPLLTQCWSATSLPLGVSGLLLSNGVTTLRSECVHIGFLPQAVSSPEAGHGCTVKEHSSHTNHSRLTGEGRAEPQTRNEAAGSGASRLPCEWPNTVWLLGPRRSERVGQGCPERASWRGRHTALVPRHCSEKAEMPSPGDAAPGAKQENQVQTPLLQMRAEQGDLTSCHILSPNPGIASGEGDTDAGARQGFLGGRVGAHQTVEPVGEEPGGVGPGGVGLGGGRAWRGRSLWGGAWRGEGWGWEG